MVCKGGLPQPLHQEACLHHTHRYLQTSGTLLLFRRPAVFGKHADLVRQLSGSPCSIWNRSAYKIKHVFISHRQTPQPEILYLYLYATLQVKQSRIPHMFFACEREDKHTGTRGRQMANSRCGTRLPASVFTELTWLTVVCSKSSTRMPGFHWVTRSPFCHTHCNRR